MSKWKIVFRKGVGLRSPAFALLLAAEPKPAFAGEGW